MSRKHKGAADVNAPPASGVWMVGLRTAPEWLDEAEGESKFYIHNVVAPGVITFFFAPRGLGKTLLMLIWAITMARAGLRVLILDRDNPKRMVKHRLRMCGVGGHPGDANLQVKFRSDVPPLTNRRAWEAFPFHLWDVVIIDSFDATTEGVSEKDTGRAAESLAHLLDIVRAQNQAGQTEKAVLVLGNTTKDGSVGRGIGPIHDRLDIIIEARDATGFRPTGERDWWHELPTGNMADFASRASRRKERKKLRFGMIASKFRIGEEPPPWITEVDMEREPWRLADVTDQVELGASEASDRIEAQTATDLKQNARNLHAALPMSKTDAEKFLRAFKMPQHKARDFINAGGIDEYQWTLRPETGRQGNPITLVPVGAQSIPVSGAQGSGSSSFTRDGMTE